MLDPSARDSSENNVPNSDRKVMPSYPVPTSGRTPAAAAVEAAAARKGTRERAKQGRKKGKEGFWWRRKVGKI